MTTNDNKKCYNSFSCILSVLIILFVICSMAYDMFCVHPQMKESIEDIRIEVRDIRQKIDRQYSRDSILFTKTHNDTTVQFSCDK